MVYDLELRPSLVTMSILPHSTQPSRDRTPRHEELLDGLERLFSEEGFRNLTLADLAARLRCSRRTLYELADTKEDLVALVVERFLTRNFAQGRAAIDSESTELARLRSFAAAVISDAERISTSFADDIFRTPRTAALVTDYDDRCVALVTSLLRAGQEAHEFRLVDPHLAAQALMAAIARIQDTSILQALDMSYGDAVSQILEIFIDGLGAGPVGVNEIVDVGTGEAPLGRV